MWSPNPVFIKLNSGLFCHAFVFVSPSSDMALKDPLSQET